MLDLHPVPTRRAFAYRHPDGERHETTAAARPAAGAGRLPQAGGTGRAPAPVTATAPQAPETASADLSTLLPQYHWQLMDATDAQGKRIDALFARADKPLQLDFKDGRWAWPIPATGWAAPYTLSDASLTLGRLTSTMMACTDTA